MSLKWKDEGRGWLVMDVVRWIQRLEKGNEFLLFADKVHLFAKEFVR